MGLYKQLSMTLEQFTGYVNTIVIALVILLGGIILGRLVDRFLHKFFIRIKFDDWCFSVFVARRNYARATRTTLVYVIYVYTVYLALQQLSLDLIAITFVSVLLLLIVAVSFVLAGVEIIPHVVGRWQLHKRGVVPGRKIEITDDTGKAQGVIETITTLDFRVKRKNGDILFYPTSMVPHVKIRLLRK